jgi:hypothetical protein
MPWVGFEPTTPVFERAKTVHALDRAATVIGIRVLVSVAVLVNGYAWNVITARCALWKNNCEEWEVIGDKEWSSSVVGVGFRAKIYLKSGGGMQECLQNFGYLPWKIMKKTNMSSSALWCGARRKDVTHVMSVLWATDWSGESECCART